MKTIWRIVLILVAAFAVTGATWAMGQTSDNSNFSMRDRGGFARPEGQAAPTNGEFRGRGDFRDGNEHHAAQFFSVRGWLGFTQTLVPMAMIIAVVALPMKFWQQRKRARRNATSALLT